MKGHVLTQSANPVKPKRSLKRVAECLWRDEISGRYYTIIKRNGRQVMRSTKTTRRNRANAILRKRLAQQPTVSSVIDTAAAQAVKSLLRLGNCWIEESSHPPVALKPPQPASLARRRLALRNLVARLPARPADLTAEHVRRWVLRRCGEVSRRTVNLELETLKSVLGYGAAKGVMRENVAKEFRRLQVTKRPMYCPSPDEVRRIVVDMRQRSRGAHGADLVELLACSGCRLNEARNLVWSDVDWRHHTLTVRASKTDAGRRVVPLFAPLERLLRRLGGPQANPAAPVVQIASAKTALIHACKRLGVSHLCHHSFRHFFITEALRQGVEPGVIARWVGHADGGTLILRTYQHVLDDWSRQRAKRITFDPSAPSAPSNS